MSDSDNFFDLSGRSNANPKRRKMTASDDQNLSDMMDTHARCRIFVQSMQRKLRIYIENADKAFSEYAIQHLNENNDQPQPVLLEVKQFNTKNKKLATKMLQELNSKFKDLDDCYGDCEDLIEKHGNQRKNLKTTLDNVEADLDRKKRMVLNSEATQAKIKDAAKRFILVATEVMEDYKNSNDDMIVVGQNVLSLKISFTDIIKSVEDSLRIQKALGVLESGAFSSVKATGKRNARGKNETHGKKGTGGKKKQAQPSSSTWVGTEGTSTRGMDRQPFSSGWVAGGGSSTWNLPQPSSSSLGGGGPSAQRSQPTSSLQGAGIASIMNSLDRMRYRTQEREDSSGDDSASTVILD